MRMMRKDVIKRKVKVYFGIDIDRAIFCRFSQKPSLATFRSAFSGSTEGACLVEFHFDLVNHFKPLGLDSSSYKIIAVHNKNNETVASSEPQTLRLCNQT